MQRKCWNTPRLNSVSRRLQNKVGSVTPLTQLARVVMQHGKNPYLKIACAAPPGTRGESNLLTGTPRFGLGWLTRAGYANELGNFQGKWHRSRVFNLSQLCQLKVETRKCSTKRTRGEVTLRGFKRGLSRNWLVSENQMGRRWLLEANCSIVLMAELPLATDWYKRGHGNEAGLEPC